MSKGVDAGAMFDDVKLINPAHTSWLKHGKGKQPPRWIWAAWEDETHWLFPRRRWPGDYPGDTLPAAEPLSLSWTLRDYQTEAVDEVLAARGGVVHAPCGAGKSVIGCGVMAMLDTPALIVTHKSDLARQWVDLIGDCLGEAAGMVGYGAKKGGESARIVVASLQTLARRPLDEVCKWAQRFGVVIIDEAHISPAHTFGMVLCAIPARYRLGLTATPERPDGLHPILHWHCGGIVYSISNQVLQSAGKTLTPTVHIAHAPDVEIDEHAEPHERDAALADDPARNALIVQVAGQLAAEGRVTLVLAKLVDHCRELAEQMKAQGLDARPLTGALKADVRASVIDAMRAGTVQVVVATSIADEGLDAPRLDAVVLAAPTGNLGRVEQRIGRVCRPHADGLPPVVVDIVDKRWRGQGYKRRRLYRERGWPVVGS